MVSWFISVSPDTRTVPGIYLVLKNLLYGQVSFHSVLDSGCRQINMISAMVSNVNIFPILLLKKMCMFNLRPSLGGYFAPHFSCVRSSSVSAVSLLMLIIRSQFSLEEREKSHTS